MKLWQKNILLLLLAAAICLLPLFLLKDAEFAGADGMAEEAITEIDEGYKPWFTPLSEPASGEIESLLFCVQAAAGAEVIGFILGRMTARKNENNE